MYFLAIQQPSTVGRKSQSIVLYFSVLPSRLCLGALRICVYHAPVGASNVLLGLDASQKASQAEGAERLQRNMTQHVQNIWDRKWSVHS